MRVGVTDQNALRCYTGQRIAAMTEAANAVDSKGKPITRSKIVSTLSSTTRGRMLTWR